MGVDLTLMPVLMRGSWLCHEMIELPRATVRGKDLLDAITDLEAPVAPAEVHGFRAYDGDGDHAYGPMTHTSYGSPLTWATAGSLVACLMGFEGADHWKVQAIRALLKHYPEDWPVVLFWH